MFEKGSFANWPQTNLLFYHGILSLQGSVKCKARVVTNIIDGVNQIVLRSTVHNHNCEIKRKKHEKLNPYIKVESSEDDGTLVLG